MQKRVRSVVPHLLLAAGVLAASAVSLSSARSVAWSLAAPALLAAVVIVVALISKHVYGQVSSMRGAGIIAAGLFVSGAMVAFADHAQMPTFMPILGACSIMALMPSRRCATAASLGQ